MRDELTQDSEQMSRVVDQHPVQALPTCGAQPDRVDVQEIAGQDALACVVRNSLQVGPDRRGAGSTPALVRMVPTVLAAIR